MNNIYIVEYSGFNYDNHLGGLIIISARSEKEALQLAENKQEPHDYFRVEFKVIKVIELYQANEKAILFVDGDIDIEEGDIITMKNDNSIQQQRPQSAPLSQSEKNLELFNNTVAELLDKAVEKNTKDLGGYRGKVIDTTPFDDATICDDFYMKLASNDNALPWNYEIYEWLSEEYEEVMCDEIRDLKDFILSDFEKVFDKWLDENPQFSDLNNWDFWDTIQDNLEEYFNNGYIQVEWSEELLKRLENIQQICDQLETETEEEWRFYGYDGFTSPTLLAVGLKNLAKNLKITDNYRCDVTSEVLEELAQLSSEDDKMDYNEVLNMYGVYLLNYDTLKTMREFNESKGLEADTYLLDIKAVFGL